MFGVDGRNQQKHSTTPVYFLLVFSILVVGIAIAGYLHYGSQKQQITKGKQNDLAAIAELKAHEISTWRKERMADAKAIFENTLIADHVRQLFQDSTAPDFLREIMAWMGSLKNNQGYKSVILAGTDGSIRFSTDEGEEICPEFLKTIPEAIRIKAPVFFDLHRSEVLNDIHFFVVIPLFTSDEHGATPVGIVFLQMDPYEFLYPLIQSWPVPSPSAETLLIRREGDNVLFLNELRHRKNTALSLSLPINDEQLPAAMAARAQEGVVDGVDYRGVPVLAAIRAVPDSPWFLIAKVDAEEVYAPIRERAWLIGLLAGLLIAGAGVSTALIWRHQRSLFYREQYEAEHERLQLAQRYEFLTRYANDILLLHDYEGKIIEANDRAIHTYGYAPDKFSRLNIRDLRHQDSLPEIEAQLRKALEQEGVVFETVHRRKDGTSFPVEVSTRVIDLDGGKFYWSIIRDISERKEAEGKIIRLNRLYAFLSQINQAIVRARVRDQLFKEACDIAAQYGKFPMAWIGLVDKENRGIRPVACSGCAEGSLGEISVPLDGGAETQVGMGNFVHKGELFAICNDIGKASVASLLDDEDARPGLRSSISVPIRLHGVVVGVFNVYAAEPDFFDEEEIRLLDEIGRDISFALDTMDQEEQRRLAEQELRQSENTYKTIFENTGTATIIVEEDTSIVLANKECEALSGYSREALQEGMSWTDFVAEEHLEMMKTYHFSRRKNPNETPRNYEFNFIDRFGNIKNVFVTVAVIPETGRSLVSLLDVTRRKEMENVLRESEASYRALAENLPGIVYRIFIQENRRTQFFNDMLEKMVGFKLDEMTQGEICSIDPLILADERDRVIHAVNLAIEQDEPFEVEYRIRHKDGTIRHFMERGRPRYGADGRPLYLDGVIFDMTEHKRMENHLRQTQKIEAIGTLAGGVAHDFNNILGAIMGYTELLLYDIPGASPLRFNLEQILNAGHRAKEIVQQILVFSRQQQAAKELQPFQLGSVIKEALTLLRASLPSTIELRRNIESEAGIALADPAQIHQVLINLCTNAAHAMKEKGGVLEVTLDEVTIGSESAEMYPELKPASHLRVTVRDSGHGMSLDTLACIFDPYFTTKEVGEGSGLGLAVVQGIVKRHGGAIRVYSEPGKGSIFHVLIPRIESRPVAAIDSDISVPGGTERILLVDDEETLVDMTTRMLRRLGYQVLSKTSSIEALEAFSAGPEQFDLVITDYTMPYMTGTDLTRELTVIRPDIPVIMCTGLNDLIKVEISKQAGIRKLLRKPVTMLEIAEAIRSALKG